MILIREAHIDDSAPIARVHVDSWRTTYKGIVSDNYLAAMSYQQREEMWKEFFQETDHFQFAYVAEAENNQIIGFASGGVNRNNATEYQGELYAIYILHEHQGKAIGRQLTEAVAKRLFQEGRKSMWVWVLERNPACRFYESLGGNRVHKKEINIGDTTLIEVGYGWKDIKTLYKST